MSAREAVERFCENRPDFALKPDWSDLEHIGRLLVEHRPEVILEYGSGCSTALFCEYARAENKKGLSLEADPLWFAENVRALKNIQGNWRVVFSPVQASGQMGLRYLYHPSIQPDFVYVDGPWLVFTEEYVADVLDFRPPPKVILVDGRDTQAAVIQSVLGDAYDLDLDAENFRATFVLKGAN